MSRSTSATRLFERLAQAIGDPARGLAIFPSTAPSPLLALLRKRESDVPYGLAVAVLIIAANIAALGAIVSASYG